jgi:BirA family biotin operon repressor/biotin-[acetyl-CoA-carboxylase] ligase
LSSIEKHKQIISLLADGEFHSGTELARVMGVSRSAIWKQLNSLSELGLDYSGVRGKGYRLSKPLELLTQDAIIEALHDQAAKRVSLIEIHDQINSTNSYLLGLAQQGAPTGMVCLAERQTAGKGRRGRQWISPFGCNIYLSILWRFQKNGLAALSGLSLAAGVAVIRALYQFGIFQVGLKWPNDLMSQGKKLGGILVEVSGESDGPCLAVIGLGLNLSMPEHQASQISQPWTDLTRLTGQKRIPRNQLIAALLNQFLPLIADYEESGIEAFVDEWRCYDCLYNKPISLILGGRQIQGIAAGIDDRGMLAVKLSDGTEQFFASGEVSFSSE